ncbi:CD209 antigen-like protein C [Oxyura jamaicensis]|uniref:CD209 antigen-like protein C n=1 Tax=Oxyura jamaicensis TaxID=8884 RepID=UPI0015A6F711|nr:CD209 antigen-like protein C [Oxyura jamaicensis]
MAQQETYGNWLGPPPLPAKRLVRQAGIYSVAGKMTPLGDFRPASPDSFADEDDYDDVSVSESDRKPPPSDEDLRSQRSKGGTGVYILAGKPASPNPSQTDNPAPGQGPRQMSVAVLYVLMALSFVAWVLLLALVLVKQVEITAELELLKSNQSETQVTMLQEMSESRQEQARVRSGMRRYYKELQDIAALICQTLPNNKCLAGWRIFERSCYYFSTEVMNWSDAKETCIDQDAHLVIVETEPEQKFLKDNMNDSNVYWMGVTYKPKGGDWFWTNGKPLSVSFWNTWSKNSNREKNNCGTMGTNGFWFDEHCSRSNHWICEKSWNC